MTTDLSARSIAPDLARGAMLLLIAIANAPWYLWAGTTRGLSSHPVDGSPLDLVAQTIALVAIDGRTYPMFAFLFGYGIWQLYSRQLAAGADRRQARRLLRRRHWWMLAFGFVHAALLWMGDIVGAYGLAGLVLTWIFLDRRDTTLKVWAAVLTGLLAIIAAGSMLGGVFGVSMGAEELELNLDASIAEESYAASVLTRILTWFLITPAQGLFGLVVPVAILVAFLWARRRVLEEPRAHLPLLRRTAIIGIAAGWGVGAVTAAQNLDLFGVPAGFDYVFTGWHNLAGLLCGIGYVALFGLIAARIESRHEARSAASGGAGGGPGRVARALQAVGRRSLTMYLAQSVVFAPLMSAWGLGLGAHLSSWSILLVAVATWLVTVAIAVLLERRGIRGPAEWMLRRLAYPRG